METQSYSLVAGKKDAVKIQVEKEDQKNLY